MEKIKPFSKIYDSRCVCYNVSKGWMCIQVFFIRQGNLIQRDANDSLQQQSEEEEFYTFIGQFYSLNQHIFPLPKKYKKFIKIMIQYITQSSRY